MDSNCCFFPPAVQRHDIALFTLSNAPEYFKTALYINARTRLIRAESKLRYRTRATFVRHSAHFLYVYYYTGEIYLLPT